MTGPSRNASVAAVLGACLVLLAMSSDVSMARAQSCGPPEASSSSGSSDSDDSSSSNSGGSSSDDDWDDSSDSGWGGSSSSSSESSGSSAPCTDRTDVTGFEECTRFGAPWNAAWPALRFEFGPSFRRLALDGLEVGGTTYHDGNPHRFFLATDDLAEASATTAGINFRFTVPILNNFLLGAEFDASFGGGPAGSVSNGDLTLEVGGVNAMGGGIVAGVVIPIGPVRFRGEVLAGGQGVTVTTRSTLGDCVSEATDVLTRFVVEPRIGVEFFVGRYISFDLWGGVDVVNPGSFGGGLRLNLHTRAYDAVR